MLTVTLIAAQPNMVESALVAAVMAHSTTGSEAKAKQLVRAAIIRMEDLQSRYGPAENPPPTPTGRNPFAPPPHPDNHPR